MKTLLLLVSTVLLFTQNLFGSDSCEQFAESKEIAPIIKTLDELHRNSVDEWPRYKIRQKRILFVSSVQPGCAVLMDSEKSFRVFELKEAISIPNGVFNICGDNFTPCPAMGKTKNLETTLIYNISAPKVTLLREKLGIDSNSTLDLYNLLHESFHIFGQFKGRRIGSWVTYSNGGGTRMRAQIVSDCYGKSSEIKNLLEQETKALENSFAAIKTGRIKVAKEWASVFLSKRKKRYGALGNFKIIDDADRAIYSCAEAEARIELDEGVPEFVSQRSLSGFTTDDNLEKIVVLFASKHPAYRFGSLQLLILAKDPNVDIQQILTGIIESKSTAETLPKIFGDWVKDSNSLPQKTSLRNSPAPK